MTFGAAALAVLLRTCAPGVGPRTMSAIVNVESGGDPSALHDNATGRSYVGLGAAAAADRASALIAQGHSVDLGLAQINNANLTRVGLTVRDVFVPCENVRAGAFILDGSYRSASARFGNGQYALRRAIGAYNTGSLFAGYDYVASVLAAAGLDAADDFRVPDLATLRPSAGTPVAPIVSPPARSRGAARSPRAGAVKRIVPHSSGAFSSSPLIDPRTSRFAARFAPARGAAGFTSPAVSSLMPIAVPIPPAP